jgi:uncharacterized protein YqhQ
MKTNRPNIGGQALIEGVFMRAPGAAAAAAARRPDGTIVVKNMSGMVPGTRSGILSRPVFRGAVNLIETLRLGFSALNWSATVAEGKDTGSKMGAFLSNLAAFALAIVLFAWLPLRLGQWIVPEALSGGWQQFLIHIFAGLFRVAAFILYIAGISLMPEIRRVFMYHGAEHQVIHAWEDGSESLAEDAASISPIHPRCGTSFLMYVMIVTIICYTIIDSAVYLISGVSPAAHWRILYHLPLIPLVMGISYEVLKAADRHMESSVLARVFSRPGLWLQRLTTRKATAEMLEVAETAARMALGMELPEGVLEETGENS